MFNLYSFSFTSNEIFPVTALREAKAKCLQNMNLWRRENPFAVVRGVQFGTTTGNSYRIEILYEVPETPPTSEKIRLVRDLLFHAVASVVGRLPDRGELSDDLWVWNSKNVDDNRNLIRAVPFVQSWLTKFDVDQRTRCEYSKKSSLLEVRIFPLTDET